jgi:hypothetical protein
MKTSLSTIAIKILIFMLSAYSSVMFGPPIRSGIEPLRLRAAALAADHFTRTRACERDPAKF